MQHSASSLGKRSAISSSCKEGWQICTGEKNGTAVIAVFGAAKGFDTMCSFLQQE